MNMQGTQEKLEPLGQSGELAVVDIQQALGPFLAKHVKYVWHFDFVKYISQMVFFD